MRRYVSTDMCIDMSVVPRLRKSDATRSLVVTLPDNGIAETSHNLPRM